MPLENSTTPLVRDGLVPALESELRAAKEGPDATFSQVQTPQAHTFSQTSTPEAHVPRETQ